MNRRPPARKGSGGEAHKITAKEAKFAVVPYSLVGKMADRLARRNYQVVVCDESHFLKVGGFDPQV